MPTFNQIENSQSDIQNNVANDQYDIYKNFVSVEMKNNQDLVDAEVDYIVNSNADSYAQLDLIASQIGASLVESAANAAELDIREQMLDANRIEAFANGINDGVSAMGDNTLHAMQYIYESQYDAINAARDAMMNQYAVSDAKFEEIMQQRINAYAMHYATMQDVEDETYDTIVEVGKETAKMLYNQRLEAETKREEEAAALQAELDADMEEIEDMNEMIQMDAAAQLEANRAELENQKASKKALQRIALEEAIGEEEASNVIQPSYSNSPPQQNYNSGPVPPPGMYYDPYPYAFFIPAPAQQQANYYPYPQPGYYPQAVVAGSLRGSIQE